MVARVILKRDGSQSTHLKTKMVTIISILTRDLILIELYPIIRDGTDTLTRVTNNVHHINGSVLLAGVGTEPGA